MKNNKKQIKNRKRYFGNALTNAFFPVVASLGITLGATCYAINRNGKSQSGEVAKSHDIEIVNPIPTEHPWKLECTTPSGEQRAKRGDTVIFTATELHSNALSTKPVGVKINNASIYDFDDELKAEVQIQFIEKMTAELVFPSGKQEHSVTFDLGYEPGEGKPRQSVVAVQHNEPCARPLDPNRDNYKFLGWFTEEIGGSKFDDFENTPIMENIILWAHWEEKEDIKPHTITLSPLSESGWNFTCSHQQAYKNDEVTFIVKSQATINSKVPVSLQLNRIVYPLTLDEETQEYKLVVKIPFIEDMTATVLFDAPYSSVVSFDTQGGSDIPPQTIEYMEKATNPGEPTKIGHTFVRWYLDNEEVAFDFANTPITQNTTIKAKWRTNSYPVIFKDEDGTVIQSKDVEFGTMPTAPTDPVKPATPEFTYKFIGWEPAISTVSVGENIYTAKYLETKNEYTVQFNTNGGTGVLSQVLKYGEKVDATKIYTEKTGHNTPVWYKDKDLQTPWDFDNDVVTKNTTLYCGWTKDVYNISFVNYDDTHLKTEPTTFGEMPVYTGEIPFHPEESGQSFEFNGWDPALKVATEPTTYKATFVPGTAQKTVKFDSHGGTYVPTQKIWYGNPVDRPTESMEKTGYVFDDWYTKDTNDMTKEEAAEFKYNFDAGVTTNLILHARWDIQKFNITFKNDDGTTFKEVDNVKYGELPTITDTPTKEDVTGQYTYTFKGWHREGAAAGQIGLEPAHAADVYTPVFNEAVNKYTVTFNTNGSSTSVPSQTKDYGSKLDEPQNVLKDGHTLEGWYTTSTFDEGTKWVFDTTTLTKNETLYAKWTINSYDVTFKYDNGDVIKTEQFEYGSTPTCDTPAKKNPVEHHKYTFVGWQNEETKQIGITPVVSRAQSYIAVFDDEPLDICKVTLELNGGTGETVLYVAKGEKISSIPTPTAPSSDVIFGGWFKDQYFSQPWTDTDVVSSNITLYVEWIPPYADESLFTTSESGTTCTITKCSSSVPDKFSVPQTIRGKTVTSVGERVFYYNDPQYKMTKLIKEIHFPYTLTSFGAYLFCDQTDLKKISCVNVNTFNTYCFAWCGMTNITVVAKSSLKLCEFLFLDCASLQTIEFVNLNSSTQTTVTTEKELIPNCDALTKFYLPRMSTSSSFDNWAFYTSSTLPYVYCNGNTQTEAWNIFNKSASEEIDFFKHAHTWKYCGKATDGTEWEITKWK